MGEDAPLQLKRSGRPEPHGLAPRKFDDLKESMRRSRLRDNR